MDEKTLTFFRKTAELESITKAAYALSVSQSQLSRVISEAERELGTPLFDHVGRTIKLNAAGKAFYEYVIKISVDYAEARAAVQAAALRQSFHISLGTNVGTYSPDLLAQFHDACPYISVHDVSAPRNTLVKQLHDGRIDFAIVCPPINEPGITTEALFDEIPLVIYPPGHWLEGRDAVTIDELKDESFISVMRGYGARDALTAYLAECGISLHPSVETVSSYLVEKYVQKGLGVAFMPKSAALQEPYSRTHGVAFDDPLVCPVALSWRTDRVLSDQQRAFLDVARNYFRSHMQALLDGAE